MNYIYIMDRFKIKDIMYRRFRIYIVYKNIFTKSVCDIFIGPKD